MKYGEYVRTIDGNIFKIINKREKVNFTLFETDCNGVISDSVLAEETKIHSKNIIDLIQVGDFVNSYKVSHKESTLLITEVKGIDRSGYHIPISQYGDEIKSILTKEMYEQNCFKVVE